MESRSITENEQDFSTRQEIISLHYNCGLSVSEISDGYNFNHEHIAEVLSEASLKAEQGFYIVESKLNYMDNRKLGNYVKTNRIRKGLRESRLL